jgi:ABC-type dipeptide/oligopeptide/nickel transport system permease component
LLGDLATEEIELITRELGLDKPIVLQYGIFLKNALKGDLGKSVRGASRPVVELVAEGFLPRFNLPRPAFLKYHYWDAYWSGFCSTSRLDFDTAGRVLAILASLCQLWVGIVLMFVIGVQWHWLPTSGYGSFRRLIMPAVALSLISLAAIVRLTRSSMLDVLGTEYVKLARIKGSEVKVIWKHA